MRRASSFEPIRLGTHHGRVHIVRDVATNDGQIGRLLNAFYFVNVVDHWMRRVGRGIHADCGNGGGGDGGERKAGVEKDAKMC